MVFHKEGYSEPAFLYYFYEHQYKHLNSFLYFERIDFPIVLRSGDRPYFENFAQNFEFAFFLNHLVTFTFQTENSGKDQGLLAFYDNQALIIYKNNFEPNIFCKYQKICFVKNCDKINVNKIQLHREVHEQIWFLPLELYFPNDFKHLLKSIHPHFKIKLFFLKFIYFHGKFLVNYFSMILLGWSKFF